MGDSYTLVTIKDIYDKIPANRVDVCMAEITEAINKAKAAEKVMLNIALTEFPESITWHDDGKGDVEIRFVPKIG